ncbi:hypothetical protein HDU77_011269 [Chytriomyces hyalinus]|nr:hypothetical protein HDU77_011269 [Chytriomyces hyalinus]
MSKRRSKAAPSSSSSRSDPSGLLHIPPSCLADIVEAPQPRQLRDGFKLFDYQLRSLTRLIEIERTCKSLVVPGVNRTLTSRGGVLADVVGMGKTAQCIALILSSGLSNSEVSLVVTPAHLCAQWKKEISKFTDGLKVEIITELRPGDMRTRIAGYDIIIASMEFITSHMYKFHLQSKGDAFSLHSVQWRRVIFDECHETILLGGENMNVLRSFQAQNALVLIYRTLYLRLDVDFYFLSVTNNPFAAASKSYRNEAFEYLKKTLYLRNTPASVSSFRASLTPAQRRLLSNTPPEPKYDEKIIFLPYTVFERSFYDERLRRIEDDGNKTKNLYSGRYQSLRQLCCHPEASEDWMKRLANLDPRTNRVLAPLPNDSITTPWTRASSSAKSRGSAPHAFAPVPPLKTNVGLSLDQLAERMIRVKKSETSKLDSTYTRIQHRIGAAENSVQYMETVNANSGSNTRVSDIVADRGKVTFYDVSGRLGKVADWAHEDETGSQRFRVIEGGSVMYVHPSVGMANLSALPGSQERMAFILGQKEWIAAEKDECRKNREEAKKIEAEIKYFMQMVDGLRQQRLGLEEKDVRNDEPQGQEVCDSGDASIPSSNNDARNCIICEEDVDLMAVLTCGHKTCRPCLVKMYFQDDWFTKQKSCPVCRKEIRDDGEIFDLDLSLKQTEVLKLKTGTPAQPHPKSNPNSPKKDSGKCLDNAKPTTTETDILVIPDVPLTADTSVKPQEPADSHAAPSTPAEAKPEEEKNDGQIAEPPVMQFVPPIVMQHGTKPAAVASFLRDALAASPDTRIIVFSKWHAMLHLLAKTLKSFGIPNLFPKMHLNAEAAELEQSAKASKSSSSQMFKSNKTPVATPLTDHNYQNLAHSAQIEDPIMEFQTSNEYRVLMLSLTENASGTNLQCANMVVLLEPASGDTSAHALATEQQAIGRAVRYGQTRRVTVCKFIVKGTIEEELYRYQEAERAKRLQTTEGNMVHLKRAQLLECEASFTQTGICIGDPKVIESEPEEVEQEELQIADEMLTASQNNVSLADDCVILDDIEATDGPSNHKRIRVDTDTINVNLQMQAGPASKKNVSKRKSAISFVCPICNTEIGVDTNEQMNGHIDDCLARNM